MNRIGLSPLRLLAAVIAVSMCHLDGDNDGGGAPPPSTPSDIPPAPPVVEPTPQTDTAPESDTKTADAQPQPEPEGRRHPWDDLDPLQKLERLRLATEHVAIALANQANMEPVLQLLD